MSTINTFLKELDEEAVTTRKMLALVPFDKLTWKPHERSMIMQNLATHIAELPSWVKMAIETDGLDFAENPYEPKTVSSTEDLLNILEDGLAESKAALKATNEAELDKPWVLSNGTEVYSSSPKREVIRMSISQTIHHRAQLGVYLRLLNIPIPGSYGPSADEMKF